jgi:nucleotide-binding universal stress UspA family protein
MSYSKILVPVVPGHGAETARAMQVARSLLSPDGSITVVTVLEDLPRYLSADVYTVEPVVEESQRAAVDQVVQEFSGSDVEVVVRHGHPAHAIVNLAQEQGHDCVVIASRQPDWHHLVLGSTAAGVVRHAHCSVHVLRDAGAPASA